MNRNLLILLATAVLSISGTAKADFDLKSYMELKEHDAVAESLKYYTTGVGRGIFWANARIGAYGGKKLFCMPPKLALDEGLIQSLLHQEIRSPASAQPYADETPVEFIMLVAFESRFPCS